MKQRREPSPHPWTSRWGRLGARRLSWSAPWWLPIPSRSGREAGPQPTLSWPQGECQFWAEASTSWPGLTRLGLETPQCFLVDKSCRLRPNEPCLLGLGEVGTTWPEFAPWAACSRFPLCPGAAGCLLGLGRAGAFYLWEGFCRGGNAPAIYWCLWRNKDLGRCKCETEAACICMCAYTCPRVHICDCVQRGVPRCVCICAPECCIKAWECAIEQVLQLVLEGVTSAMGEPETGFGRTQRGRERKGGGSCGLQAPQCHSWGPPPTSGMSPPLASAACSMF